MDLRTTARHCQPSRGDDAVADRHRAVRAGGEIAVVGDVEDRRALGVEPLQQVEHLGRGAGVEVAGRLVADQQRRVVGQRAGDRDPLLLAAGQLRRQLVGLVRQIRRARGCAARSARALALGAAVREKSSGSIAFSTPSASAAAGRTGTRSPTRSPAPDGELLLAHRVDPPAADRDRPGGRPVDAGDHVHDRRLAAARTARRSRPSRPPAIVRSTPRSARYSTLPVR